MHRRTRINAADVLVRAQATVASARAARERSEEIRLHLLLAGRQQEPPEVGPADEAVLRERLDPEDRTPPDGDAPSRSPRTADA